MSCVGTLSAFPWEELQLWSLQCQVKVRSCPSSTDSLHPHPRRVNNYRLQCIGQGSRVTPHTCSWLLHCQAVWPSFAWVGVFSPFSIPRRWALIDRWGNRGREQSNNLWVSGGFRLRALAWNERVQSCRMSYSKNKFLKIRLSLECNWLGVRSGQWEKELAQLLGREIKPAQAECVISSLILRQRNGNEEEASKEKSPGSKGGSSGVAGLEKQSYPPSYIQWPCVQNARQLICWPGVRRRSVLPCSLQPMDCNRPPGSSVHGDSLGEVLEWVAMPSSRGSSQPRDQTQVSHIAGRFFTIWATREAFSRQAFFDKLDVFNCLCKKSQFCSFKGKTNFI